MNFSTIPGFSLSPTDRQNRPAVEMAEFALNARCLAYHGPLLYEAKIVKIYDPVLKKAKTKESGAGEKDVSTKDLPEDMTDDYAYFVHYKGWKSTWDEWVDKSRILQWNEENIRMQKELKQQALAALSRKKAGSGGRAGSPSPSEGSATAGTKRKESDAPPSASTRSVKRRGGASHQDADLEKEDDFMRRPEIAIKVPDSLKARLVDDWEYVTKDHTLVSLPRSPNVVDILKQYRAVAAPKRKTSAEADIFDEVLSGLKLYFDRSLGNVLLYRFERQQYLEARKAHPDKAMSEIYGAEHLLRLFVALPGLIAQTNMDEQGVGYLKRHLEDMLKYLANHQEDLFMSSYEHTSPRYEAMATGL